MRDLEKLAIKEMPEIDENIISRKEQLAPNKQFPLLWFAIELLFKLIMKKLDKKQDKK